MLGVCPKNQAETFYDLVLDSTVGSAWGKLTCSRKSLNSKNRQQSDTTLLGGGPCITKRDSWLVLMLKLWCSAVFAVFYHECTIPSNGWNLLAVACRVLVWRLSPHTVQGLLRSKVVKQSWKIVASSYNLKKKKTCSMTIKFHISMYIYIYVYIYISLESFTCLSRSDLKNSTKVLLKMKSFHYLSVKLNHSPSACTADEAPASIMNSFTWRTDGTW